MEPSPSTLVNGEEQEGRSSEEKNQAEHESYKKKDSGHPEDIPTAAPSTLWKVRRRSRSLEISATEITPALVSKVAEALIDEDMFYSCSHCTFSCYDSEEFTQHIEVREAVALECQHCNFKSCTALGMTKHTGYMHPDVNVNATEIVAPPTEEAEIITETISSKSDYECNYCSRKFEWKTTFDYNIRTHTGERPFKCNYCSFAGIDSSALRRHITSRSGQVFQCPNCELTFCYAKSLRRHLKAYGEDESGAAAPPVWSEDGQDTDEVEEDEEEGIIEEMEIEEHIDTDQGSEDTILCEKEMEETLPAMKCCKEGLLLHKNHCPSPPSQTSASPLSITPVRKGSTRQIKRPTKFAEVEVRLVRIQTGPPPEGVVAKKVRKVFNCPFCQKIAKNRVELETHIMIHTGEKPFECSRCSYSTAYNNRLESHMKSAERLAGQLYLCLKCDFKACTSNVLTVHRRKSHPEIAVKLRKRLKRGRPPLLSKQEVKVQEAIEPAVCKPALVLIDRELQESPLEILVCPFCKKQFKNERYLKDHVRTHTGEKPFKCDLCSFASAQSSGLFAHKLRRGEVLSNCPHCPFTSCNALYLRRHMRETHLNPVASPRKQPQAGEPQPSFKLQETKIKKIRGVKRHKCRFCNYRADWRSTMASHERSHTGDKPFECKICGYKFSQVGNFYRHKLSHVISKSADSTPNSGRSQNLGHFSAKAAGEGVGKRKEESFQFEERTFISRPVLKGNPGSNKKVLQCESCQFRTKDPGTMVIHTRVHTGEKPYKCRLCPYRGARKYSVKQHEKTHGILW